VTTPKVQEDTQECLSYLSADGGVEGVSERLTVALGVGIVFGFDHYADDGRCRSRRRTTRPLSPSAD
jgi:hypothetical protein